MNKGKVKYYDQINGFGFIIPEDGSEDLFIVKSGLLSDIKKDDMVEYMSFKGPNGMNADKVKKI